MTRSCAELLRQPRVELVQRAVRDRAAEHRVDLGVDRLRRDDALDQPGRRAVGEPLELGDAERRLAAEELGADARVALQGAARAAEAPLPVVGVGERPRLVGVGNREPGERTQPLAVGRRGLERPGERRERTAARRPLHVLGLEDRGDLVPERARLARGAVVGGRLAHEEEPARRAGARRVEEVAVAGDLVGALEPAAERAACVVARGRATCAPRRGSAPFLEPEHEDDVEAAGPRAQQVEDGDAACFAGGGEPHFAALERSDHVVALDTSPARPGERVELVEERERGAIGAQVEPRRLAGGRRFGAVGAAQHPPQSLADRLGGDVGGAQLVERRQRRLAQLLGLRLDALRAPESRDRAAGPRRSRPTSARARSTATAGRRTALGGRRPATRNAGAAAARARAASRRSGRATRPRTGSRGRRAPSRAGHATTRATAPPARSARAATPLRRSAGELLADLLERAAHAGALEEADAVAELGRRPGRLLEEAALEMRERRVRVLGESAAAARRGDRRRARTGRSAVRVSEANAVRPGSYGSETCTSVRPASASSSAHSARGQVLEAVGEDGLSVPGVELGPEPLGRTPPLQVAIRDARGGRARRDRRRRARRARRRGRPGRGGPARALRACRSARRRSHRSVPSARGRPAAQQRAPAATTSRRCASVSTRGGPDRLRRAAGRGRRRCRSRRRAGSRSGRAGRARRGRRPTRSARSDTARRRDGRDTGRGGARPCPRLQALRGGTAPPSHRRVAAGRVPRPLPTSSRSVLSLPLCGRRLRPASAAGGRTAGHLAGAVVTEIGDLRASARIRIRDAQYGAVRLVDLLPAVVANQNGFPCQFQPPFRFAGSLRRAGGHPNSAP